MSKRVKITSATVAVIAVSLAIAFHLVGGQLRFHSGRLVATLSDKRLSVGSDITDSTLRALLKNAGLDFSKAQLSSVDRDGPRPEYAAAIFDPLPDRKSLIADPRAACLTIGLKPNPDETQPETNNNICVSEPRARDRIWVTVRTLCKDHCWFVVEIESL